MPCLFLIYKFWPSERTAITGPVLCFFLSLSNYYGPVNRWRSRPDTVQSRDWRGRSVSSFYFYSFMCVIAPSILDCRQWTRIPLHFYLYSWPIKDKRDKRLLGAKNNKWNVIREWRELPILYSLESMDGQLKKKKIKGLTCPSIRIQRIRMGSASLSTSFNSLFFPDYTSYFLIIYYKIYPGRIRELKT